MSRWSYRTTRRCRAASSPHSSSSHQSIDQVEPPISSIAGSRGSPIASAQIRAPSATGTVTVRPLSIVILTSLLGPLG